MPAARPREPRNERTAERTNERTVERTNGGTNGDSSQEIPCRKHRRESANEPRTNRGIAEKRVGIQIKKYRAGNIAEKVRRKTRGDSNQEIPSFSSFLPLPSKLSTFPKILKFIVCMA